MPTFTPPVGQGVAWGDEDSYDPEDRLMRYYGAIPNGETVWRDQGGVYHQQQYPSQGKQTFVTFNDGKVISSTTGVQGLGDATEVYLGGHTYEITDTTANDLIAAGYGAYINTAPVDLRYFTSADLPKFSEWLMTVHSNSVYSKRVTSSEDLEFYETSGDQLIQDNSRRFFIHADTHYNNDFDAQVILDPPFYGVFGIAEQSGVVLRAQQSGGVNRGVTINNNIFFVVPNCNIGVWSSNTDGTNFQNRQASLSIGLVVPFPQHYDVKLRGNIATVRVFGDKQAVPLWSDPVYAKTVNLDTEAGTAQQIIDNPTPVGDGGAGLISAHLGTAEGIASRFRIFRVGPAGSLFND